MYKAMYKAFIKKVKFLLTMSLSMCKDFFRNVNFKTFSHLKHLMPMNMTFIKTVNFKNCFTSYVFGQVMNFFIEVAEAKEEEEAKKKLTELRDSPRTVDMFMKTFSYKDSKFQTICHADFWTSQIMFSLNEDGEKIHPPKYLATPGLNICLFQEVQSESRSSTTRC